MTKDQAKPPLRITPNTEVESIDGASLLGDDLAGALTEHWVQGLAILEQVRAWAWTANLLESATIGKVWEHTDDPTVRPIEHAILDRFNGMGMLRHRMAVECRHISADTPHPVTLGPDGEKVDPTIYPLPVTMSGSLHLFEKKRDRYNGDPEPTLEEVAKAYACC